MHQLTQRLLFVLAGYRAALVAFAHRHFDNAASALESDQHMEEHLEVAVAQLWNSRAI